jgi:phosphinothricin acetyltransferase
MTGGQRYVIRSAVPADVPAITAIYAPVVEHSIASFELVPPDEAEMARRLRSGSGLPWLVAAYGDQVAGYAYASRFRHRPAYRWSVETSVYVADAYAGRGVGKGLMAELLARLGADGYVMAFAAIALPNPVSERLHESLGFRPVGVFRDVGFKHGGWRDVAWWSKQLRSLPEDPAEPVVHNR